jgi:hypothetical protein
MIESSSSTRQITWLRRILLEKSPAKSGKITFSSIIREDINCD